MLNSKSQILPQKRDPAYCQITGGANYKQYQIPKSQYQNLPFSLEFWLFGIGICL